MLVVKSEGACSLTLVPGQAPPVFAGIPGKIHDLQASPDSSKDSLFVKSFLLPYHS
jgi:hypothetical protein